MENIDFNKLSKTKDGREKILSYLDKQSVNLYLSQRDNECWTLYNNTGDDKEFTYLTQIGSFELPAKIRMIPIQRSKANILISQQSKRRVVHKVTLNDKKSVSGKLNRLFDALLVMAYNNVEDKLTMIQAELTQLEQQQALIQQQANSQPETPEEQAMVQQAKMALPMLMVQFDNVRKKLMKITQITNKDKTKINEFFEMKYEDIMESYSKRLLNLIKKSVKAERVSLTAFVHKIVIGREYFYVNYVPGDEKLEYKAVVGQKIIQPDIESIEFTQELPWIGIEEVMTKEQIRKSFKLNTTQLNKLKGLKSITTGSDTGAFIAGPGQTAILNESGSGGHKDKYSLIQEGYLVRRFWWRTDEQLDAIIAPNKNNESLPFIKFTKDKPVISLADFKYDSKKKRYVSIENKEVTYKKNEVFTYSPNKGEVYERRYFDVRYTGAVIDNQLFISEIDPVQPRQTDDYKYVPLPVFGRTYSGIGDYPYSMFWATRELQKQYWVITYFRELTFALAGASGVVFDMSQKPDGFTDDYWFYQMKQGRFLIETLTKSGAPKKTSFNQFQRVDQGVPQSIQYFEFILQGLDNQIGLIMGVPPQRLGVVAPTDQVGTYEQSNEQAMLVTEILYEEHDEIERQALTHAFNLGAQYLYKPGDVISFPEDLTAVWTIPNGFNKIKAEVNIEVTREQELELKELKTIAKQETLRGALPIDFLPKIFTVETIKELEAAVVVQAQRQQEIARLNAQATEEAKAAAEQKKIELENTYKLQIESINNKVQEAKNKMDAYQKDMELKLKEKEIMQKAKDDLVKNTLEAQSIQNEFVIEAAAINEDKRANITEEKLKGAELQIEAALGQQKNQADIINGKARTSSKEKVRD